MIKEEIGIYQDSKNKKTTIVIHNMSKKTRDMLATILLNDLEVQEVTGLTEIERDMTCLDPSIDGMNKVEPDAKAKKANGAKRPTKAAKELPVSETTNSEPAVSPVEQPMAESVPETARQDAFMNPPVENTVPTETAVTPKTAEETSLPQEVTATAAETAAENHPETAPDPKPVVNTKEEIPVCPEVPEDLMPPVDSEEPYEDEPIVNASETVAALWQSYDETNPLPLLKEFVSVWAKGTQDEKVAAAMEIDKLMEMTAKNRRRTQSLFWEMQCFEPYAAALMSAARQKGFGDGLTIGTQEYMNAIVNTLNALSDEELMILAKGAAKNMLAALTPLFTIN